MTDPRVRLSSANTRPSSGLSRSSSSRSGNVGARTSNIFSGMNAAAGRVTGSSRKRKYSVQPQYAQPTVEDEDEYLADMQIEYRSPDEQQFTSSDDDDEDRPRPSLVRDYHRKQRQHEKEAAELERERKYDEHRRAMELARGKKMKIGIERDQHAGGQVSTSNSGVTLDRATC